MKVSYTLTRNEIKKRTTKLKRKKPGQQDKLNIEPLKPLILVALKK